MPSLAKRFTVKDRITGYSVEFAELVEAVFLFSSIQTLGNHPAEIHDNLSGKTFYGDCNRHQYNY